MGYFFKIYSADLFLICDTVQFERRGYSNRVQVKTHTGAQWLSVPVEHGQPLLKDAKIAGNQNWQRKHLRAIELAYQKAPYFDRYFPDLKEMLDDKWRFLASLDEALLRYFLDALGIQTPVVRASDYDFHGEKSALVLDMGVKLGATRYIFGQKGRDYADIAAFTSAGIEVEFQNYKHPVYPQLHGPFVPGLSILDLLMNCGGNSLNVLRGTP